MQDTPDEILVKEFLGGNEQAFNAIAIRYRKKIYEHAFHMLGNHMDADELVQEVLLTIYRKLGTFNKRSALYTWIYRITYTRCLNYLKKQKLKRWISLEDNNKENFYDSTDIEEDIDNREKLERVKAELKKLPPKQREIFVMRNFDGLSYDEISEITGKSVGALKANYFYAIKKVTESFDENK